MATGICPACDEDVRLNGRVRVGQVVTCLNCGARIEVVDVDPVELDWAEDGEDELVDEEAADLGLDSEATDQLLDSLAEDELDGFHLESDPLDEDELVSLDSELGDEAVEDGL